MLKSRIMLYLSILLVVLVVLFFTGRKSVHHEIIINASPAAVWSVLADTDKYKDWNPVMLLKEGSIQEGQKVLYQFTQAADKQYDIQCLKSYKRVDILGLIDDAIDLKKLIPEDTQNSNQTITIEQYNSIAGNIQELLRKNNISSGNYNERIEGNYYEQKGDNNKMTNVTQTHSGSGDNVAGDKNVTNNYNSQDLTQAAADIQALLKQLEETNPIDTPLEQMTVGVKLAEEIKKNPTRRQKVIKVIKAMGIEALAEAVDNPVFNIAKAGIEAALESES